MNILKQLFNNGWTPGTCSELVDFIVLHAHENGVMDKYRANWSENAGLYKLQLIYEANKELRKPLSINDFVRPERPEKPGGKEDSLLMLSYNQEIESWKKWQPLFEGWKTAYIATGTEFRKGDYLFEWFPVSSRIYLYSSISNSISVTLEKPSREDFIRACKEHNISLLPTPKDTKNLV